VEVPDPSPAQVFNMPTTSVVVIEHPQRGICPVCGDVVAVVANINVALAAAPAPPDANKPLIVSPGSFRPN